MARIALLTLLALAPIARALGPENLLLITNKNVPESRPLAEFYAAQRKAPDGRILELDLPTADECSFAEYETHVMPAVREFLTKHALADKVTSAVTFYGVPLKVAARVNAVGDPIELAAVRKEHIAVLDQAQQSLGALEAIAKEVEPGFAPTADKGLPGIVSRNFAARGAMGRYGKRIEDPAKFEAFMNRIEQAASPLDGPAQIKQRRLRQLNGFREQLTPEQKAEAKALTAELLAMRAKFDALQLRRADPEGRSDLRQLVKAQLGLIEYARLLESMIEYFNAANSDAAFDSELALVWWNGYAHANSLGNPLNYRARRGGELPPVLMTMRLDAPEAHRVRDMISAGIKAEAAGLTGKVVIDAGGNLTIDVKDPAARANYAAFDQTLKRLHDIVSTRTKLTVVFDDKAAVLPAGSADDVALYCGWYALMNYTPACKFVPGAVGYHIASFELTSLRNPNRGWCRGLLGDGVAATLGAVNEPFLHAFPPPDEFFPLLLSGKLTLAEVYWKTSPLVSWRIAMIGDPLYTPFKANPAIAPDALPTPLQAAIRPAAGAAIPR